MSQCPTCYRNDREGECHTCRHVRIREEIADAPLAGEAVFTGGIYKVDFPVPGGGVRVGVAAERKEHTDHPKRASAWKTWPAK